MLRCIKCGGEDKVTLVLNGEFGYDGADPEFECVECGDNFLGSDVREFAESVRAWLVFLDFLAGMSQGTWDAIFRSDSGGDEPGADSDAA